MKTLLALIMSVFLAGQSLAANLTPILISNGEARMVCDGQFRFMSTAPMTGKQVVASYLFANLLTDSGYGLDIILWSPSYWSNYPPPYEKGPSSQWGSIGDLHIFSRPDGHTGGRQGERYMSFQPDGILINDHIQLVAICWGGGTAEIYAQVWVRDVE